jgi:hypothetical protein
MITPIKKPPYRDLLDWEKEFNTAVNKIRYLIEQTIANLKTWRILHTGYRRPLATSTTTISTVIALQFYAISRITLIGGKFPLAHRLKHPAATALSAGARLPQCDDAVEVVVFRAEGLLIAAGRPGPAVNANRRSALRCGPQQAQQLTSSRVRRALHALTREVLTLGREAGPGQGDHSNSNERCNESSRNSTTCGHHCLLNVVPHALPVSHNFGAGAAY